MSYKLYSVNTKTIIIYYTVFVFFKTYINQKTKAYFSLKSIYILQTLLKYTFLSSDDFVSNQKLLYVISL